MSSNPPGTRYSVPLETQAEWINQGDYMAYRDSGVRSVAQFALEDDPSFGRDTFQTGICFYNQPNPCYPKPAYDAYRVPIYVVDRGRNVLIYGQARPATAAQRRIELQNRADANAAVADRRDPRPQHRRPLPEDIPRTPGQLAARLDAVARDDLHQPRGRRPLALGAPEARRAVVGGGEAVELVHERAAE